MFKHSYCQPSYIYPVPDKTLKMILHPPKALVMAEVPDELALSGSSLVVLSVLAFALEQPILSLLSKDWHSNSLKRPNFLCALLQEVDDLWLGETLESKMEMIPNLLYEKWKFKLIKSFDRNKVEKFFFRVGRTRNPNFLLAFIVLSSDSREILSSQIDKQPRTCEGLTPHIITIFFPSNYRLVVFTYVDVNQGIWTNFRNGQLPKPTSYLEKVYM